MGFLDFSFYKKEGKGIKKQDMKKKRISVFFGLFFRKFWDLIKLNFLYILFCIPIVTIGPATVALSKITRYYIEEKPVFLFSDFVDAFKENFLQGFLYSIFHAVITYMFLQSGYFYYINSSENIIYNIAFGVLLALFVIFLFSTYYAYLMICTVKLSLKKILKNSFSFAIIGMKSNFLTLVFIIPIFITPFIAIMLFSLSSLIISFNSFQYIYKYSIKPYYEKNDIDNPYEKNHQKDEHSVFSD